MDRSPLREYDVRLVVGAVGISALGDFLLWIPLTLRIAELSGSGLAMAGLFLALWTPLVVLAPVAGLVVDRREARGVLLAASLAQMVVAAALAFALDSVAAIIALAALLGTGFAFAQPAEFALVPVVAHGQDLTRVNGLVETARYSGMALGPVLGGVLAGLGGTDVAMFVNAGTFAVLAAAALVLHARRPPQAVPEGGHEERARDGIAYLFRDRTLAIAMGVLFLTLLFMTASVTAEVFFLKEDLNVADAVYGVVFGAWTVGMIFGALVVARRVPRHLLALGVLFATLVQGAGLGLPTAWLVVAFAAAMWFIGGTGHGTKNTLARTLIQDVCRTGCTAARLPPTTPCETAPSCSPSRAGASSSRPSADAPRSRSRAAYPWRWRSPDSCSTAARRPPADPSPSRPTDGKVLSTGVIHSCGLGWARISPRCDAPRTCAAVSRR